MPQSKKDTYFDKIKTRGSPRNILNEAGKELIRDLAQYQCTDEEIASCLGVTVETLQNPYNKATFLECKQKGKEQGRASLRRIQFELAKKNSAMAIWLGKNFLGQRDDFVATIRGDKETNNTIKIELVGTDKSVNPREIKNEENG